MAKAFKENVWFGVLETSQSSTIVVQDHSLPEASIGRMYLYNSDRGHIVEYVESIVSAKLRELTEEERSTLNPTLEKEFQVGRKAFLKDIGARGNVYKLKTEGSNPKSTKPEVVDEVPLEINDSNIDEDDWIDEDDNNT